MNLNQVEPTPIPIPPGKTGLTSLLREMKPCKRVKGQLVGIPLELELGKRGSVYELAKRIGIKVTVRTVGDGKIRVWRLPDDGR